MGLFTAVDVATYCGVFFLIWVVYDWLYVKYTTKNEHKALPGPIGLPIVGSILSLGSEPWVTFQNWAQSYGPIFQVKMGNRRVIVLNSIDAIKDAFNNSAFNGRPDFATLSVFRMSSGRAQFTFRSGDMFWKFGRKTAMRALNLFGSSKNSRLENVVTEVTDSFHLRLQATEQKGTSPKYLVTNLVGKMSIAILYGFRADDDEPLLKSFADSARKFGEFVKVGGVADYMYGGAYWTRNMVNQFAKEVFKPIFDYTAERIAEHAVHEDGAIEDVQDALAAAAKEADPDTLRMIGTNEHEIRLIAQDILGAALGTTSDTLHWCLNILAAYPHIQMKIHDEVTTQCGTEKITCNHMPNMTYTRAFLTEMYRYVSLVPLSLPHSTMSTTDLWGYHIPADYVVCYSCLVLGNLYAHHFDPNVFTDPDQFKPERFINTTDGTFDHTKAEQVIAFSVGKRRCIGETMARQEIFMVVSRVVQAFEISPEKGETVDPSKGLSGFTIAPVEYKLVFKKRI